MIGNIIVTKLSPAKQNTYTKVTVKSINEEFEKTLSEFDLKTDWFRKIAVKRKGDDSLKYVYRVRVPKDLPIPVILNEMNLKMRDEPLRIASREIRSNKQSNMRIFYGDRLVHESDFITDTSINRSKPAYGFMINDIESLSDNELNELLAYPEKFSLLLTPSQRSESLKQKIIDSGREFVLLLGDDIPEVKYRLDENYNPGRLNGSVTNIIKAFGEARLFLLDSFANSRFSAQVENLFTKRKIKIVPLSRFAIISEKDYFSLSEDLKNHIKRSQGSDIFMISSKDFTQLYGEFKNLRKRGYKFIIPSAINYCI